MHESRVCKPSMTLIPLFFIIGNLGVKPDFWDILGSGDAQMWQQELNRSWLKCSHASQVLSFLYSLSRPDLDESRLMLFIWQWK